MTEPRNRDSWQQMPLALVALWLLTGAAAMAQTADQARVAAYWPTGDRATSVLLIERFAPNPLLLNKDYEYQLRVTNVSNGVLREVHLAERQAEHYKLNGTNPQAQSMSDGRLHWALGNLAPGEAKVVRLHGAATQLGEIRHCATVWYEAAVCQVLDVVQPALALTQSAPAQVFMCDTIPLELTVSNTGVGPARNVVIRDQLPAGLTTTDGQSSVAINVGMLPAGESRGYIVNTRAANRGVFENTASATADGGLTAQASSATRVVQPVLTLTKTAPQMRFVGRPIDYEMTVTNRGDGVAKNTVLEDTLPQGVEFHSASAAGEFANGRIVWRLGDLEPGASRRVTARVVGTALSTIENRAEARAYCADAAVATAVTRIGGIPAILLEVIDEIDPVEVGADTVYMIRVTNQGSLADTNVTIVCELEDSMQYISATGATPATVEGTSIRFAPLATLPPKTQAVWRITVKAIESGDARFSVELSSDQIGRPVNETEATNFYQ
jgi:uncharacterized repeat protein (TIGR01451 family)